MGEQEASAKKMAAGAKAIADSAQAELDLALPALDSALASLKSLTRNDIVEVKSLRNPPQGVKMVMEATCIMFNLAPKMVADPNKVALSSTLTSHVVLILVDCSIWETCLCQLPRSCPSFVKRVVCGSNSSGRCNAVPSNNQLSMVFWGPWSYP